MLIRDFCGFLKPSHIALCNATKRNIHNTHYDVLGLPKNCSRKEIKDAFIKLSKLYHPDTNCTTASKQQFVKINEAYNILSKPGTRRDYDTQLMHNSPYSYTDLRQTMKHRGYRGRHYGFENTYTYYNSYNRYEGDDYYGIRGIRRVSNATIAFGCIALTAVGALVQFYFLRHDALLKREKLKTQSMENEMLLASIKAKAEANGNDLQLQILERKFKDQDYLYRSR